MRIISHKGKDLIKAKLANKLYKTEIKFKVGRGKSLKLSLRVTQGCVVKISSVKSSITTHCIL